MKITENLNKDLIVQLNELYDNVWFTKGRKLDDIKIMLKNSYITLAFIEGQELIGFCRVVSDGVYKAFIYDVIVKDSYQNRGIGKLIMESLLAHKRLKGVRHIELYCPERITGFYKKLGFDTRSSLLMRYDKI